MTVDAMSAALRGLSFVALFQATGSALFLAIFDPQLREGVLARLVRWSAGAALVLLAAQYFMEAGRMAGEYAGVFDLELQKMVAQSSLVWIFLLRCVALALLLICFRFSSATPSWPSVCATAATVISFALTGHTASRPYHLSLSVLLIVHVAVVLFWFGSLAPLLIINASTNRQSVAAVVERFSRLALRIVPALFAAGALLIAGLFYTPRNFLEPYGLILLGKLCAFFLLMALAALNRWRLGPQLSASAEAARSFAASVVAEYVLIAGALVATAVLTTFFSPSEFVSR